MTSRFFEVCKIGLILAVIGGLGVRSVYASSNHQATTQHNTLPLKALQTFSEVFQRIKQDYVKPVSDKKLLDNAIQGMLSGLDPHSAYLDARAFRQLQIDTSGEFGGLGIVVSMNNGFVQVVSPIDGTPAQRAGLKSGDIITRINGKPVQDLSLDQTVKMMRGKPGSKVKLEVARKGDGKPLHFTIKREIIHIDSVKSRMLEPGYAYIRIASFQANTAASLKKAIKKLDQENKNRLDGLILDLRNNPGGVLNAAIDVSNAFLNRGLIVYTKGRMADSNVQYKATKGDILHDVPMVVLVNGGTASAAEIVSGALKDNHRALIVGTRTFGKGSVQTVLPLSHNTGVKLTTALYFTPNGRSIQAEGIQPNIVVQPLAIGKPLNESYRPLREADLEGHLANPEGNPLSPKKNQGILKLAHTDFQLYEGLTILKSLVLSEHLQHPHSNKVTN